MFPYYFTPGVSMFQARVLTVVPVFAKAKNLYIVRLANGEQHSNKHFKASLLWSFFILTSCNET
jgi:hypothetical protein